MNRLISIIIPTFNRADVLEEMLKSVLAQTYGNWECLIIDDGSTDNTENVLQSYLVIDSRFSLFKRDEKYLKGPSGCRNMGIDMCKGDYIIFFDSDDIVHPQLLAICMDRLEKNEILFCNFEKIPFNKEFLPSCFQPLTKGNSTLINIKNIEEIVTQKLGFACCTILWDKKVIKGNYFNETLSYAEEWEFYIRLMCEDIKGIHIDNVLYYHRKHSTSNTAEFWNSNTLRVASKIRAIKLVIDILKEKELLTISIVKYFIRWGFQFQKREIIEYVLKKSEASTLDMLKYKLGYFCYPLLKSVFKLKGKILKL